MKEISLTPNNSRNAQEAVAQHEGAMFGKDIGDLLKNWEGPATIATLAGYIAAKKGMPIGNAQLSVGLAMVTAGAVAEAITLKEQHRDMGIKQLEKKVAKEWLKRLQGPSHVSLLIGIVGMLKEIKGAEAAFIAGALGTVLNIMPALYEEIQDRSSDEHRQR